MSKLEIIIIAKIEMNEMKQVCFGKVLDKVLT